MSLQRQEDWFDKLMDWASLNLGWVAVIVIGVILFMYGVFQIGITIGKSLG